MTSGISMEQLFNTALLAAQSAGHYIYSHLHETVTVNYKGETNLVTQVDRKAEEMIISIIREAFPEHRILAEESPALVSDSPYRWIIDPLDGTTNFVHGVPIFSVSIALEYGGELLLGVVYDPCRKEIFSAIRGQGAYVNKEPIRVSATPTLIQSLTATGFPYENGAVFDANMQIFSEVYRRSQGVRRAGSAALDICYVASGRFDGFWEFSLNPWDVAAGALIVLEAGGRVEDFNGGQFCTENASRIIATNGLIHTELLNIIRQHLPK